MRAVKPFCHQSSRNGSRHKGRKNYNRLKIHISTMLQQDGDNTIVTFVTGQYQREPPFLRYRRSERRRSSKRKDILTELIPLMSLARPFSIISLTLLSSLALIAEWRGKEEAIQDFPVVGFQQQQQEQAEKWAGFGWISKASPFFATKRCCFLPHITPLVSF
jgi:hypothetical protein